MLIYKSINLHTGRGGERGRQDDGYGENYGMDGWLMSYGVIHMMKMGNKEMDAMKIMCLVTTGSPQHFIPQHADILFSLLCLLK